MIARGNILPARLRQVKDVSPEAEVMKISLCGM
jgi:hypothetical protein